MTTMMVGLGIFFFLGCRMGGGGCSMVVVVVVWWLWVGRSGRGDVGILRGVY